MKKKKKSQDKFMNNKQYYFYLPLFFFFLLLYYLILPIFSFYNKLNEFTKQNIRQKTKNKLRVETITINEILVLLLL